MSNTNSEEFTAFVLNSSSWPHNCSRCGKITVSVVKADISDLGKQVDVIVNVASRNLDLKRGAASSALLNYAGKKIQDEVNANKESGNIDEGEIVVSSGGNLQCKEIYHTTLWRKQGLARIAGKIVGKGGDNEEEVITKLVDHCLTKAASSGYKTLAFPALGTGRLQYNKRTVANAMFDAVEHYSASNPSSPITDALFVVIPVDTDVVQEFENRCKRKNTNRGLGAHVLPSPQRQTPEYCRFRYVVEIRPPPYWTSFTADSAVKDWALKLIGKPQYTIQDVDEETFELIDMLVQKTWESSMVGIGRDAEGLAQLRFFKVKVTRIQRIENLLLFEHYAQYQQRLLHEAAEASMFPILATTPSIKSGESKIEALLPTTWKMERLLPEVNEGYFFHGTKPEVVENVICQGLDIRMAGTALLGRAIYLAESSTKADQYTDLKDKRAKQGRQMFLVRASLGHIHGVQKAQTLKRPPCTEPSCLSDTCGHEDRFHSVVVDGQYIFREFVVYDRNLVYPEYLITYDRV